MFIMSNKTKILLQLSLVLLLALILFLILEGGARIWGPKILPVDNSRKVAHGESLPNEPNMIGDALLG